MLDGVVVSDVPAEPLPPIMKMCRCCEEVRPHARAKKARFHAELTQTQYICCDCNGSVKDLRTLFLLSVAERRAKRDAKIEANALAADRKSRNVAWCARGAHEVDLKFMSPAAPSRRLRGSTHSATCRSCQNVYSRSYRGRTSAVFLVGDALLADNEACYQRWLLKQDATVRSALGIRAKDRRQTDISVECAKIGAEPGRINTPKPAETPEQIAARRQARFEKSKASPKESRQVRRARERRIIKDARSESKRQLTDAEVVAVAIDRSIAARGRATGGKATSTRTRKAVKWNLPPNVVADIIKRQGYKCALTGRSFEASIGWGTHDPFQPSPNRIDPGQDYVAENCEFVCVWVNRLISDMPRAKALEFMAELKLLRKNVGQMTLL